MLALEGALLSFLVAASFINRARAEMLYWLILFIAIASNIYYLRFIEPERKNPKAVSAVGIRKYE